MTKQAIFLVLATALAGALLSVAAGVGTAAGHRGDRRHRCA